MKYKRLIKIIGIIIVSMSFTSNIFARNTYQVTPSDMEGPFYPIERQADEDNDLLHVSGLSGSAKGDVLNLQGVVIDVNGVPQGDVVIEIWQTDANGLYRHPREMSPGKRDPFFQYWGRAKTDEEGKYSFTTLIPGEYEPRPAHIHFKVWVKEKVVLTSQMYIVTGNEVSPRVNDLLQLQVTKDDHGEYSAFFRIVL